MNHLKIIIDLPVDERLGKLTQHEAEESAKQAYQAARRALPHFVGHHDENYYFEIEN